MNLHAFCELSSPGYLAHGVLPRNVCALLTLFLILLTVAGCGSSDVMNARGSVNYHGKPLQNGRIVFHPQIGRLAFSDIHDGQFTLTTTKPNDGAKLGVYRVTVHCDVPSNPKDAFSDLISQIPTRYQKPESSGLTAEVKAGQANVFRFDLTD